MLKMIPTDKVTKEEIDDLIARQPFKVNGFTVEDNGEITKNGRVWMQVSIGCVKFSDEQQLELLNDYYYYDL